MNHVEKKHTIVKPLWFDEKSECRFYEKDFIIFLENDRVKGSYWIGRKKIILSKSHNPIREQNVRFASEVSFIGQKSLLLSDTYTETTRTISDSRL